MSYLATDSDSLQAALDAILQQTAATYNTLYTDYNVVLEGDGTMRIPADPDGSYDLETVNFLVKRAQDLEGAYVNLRGAVSVPDEIYGALKQAALTNTAVASCDEIMENSYN